MDTPVCFARFRTSETCLVSVHENLPDCFSKLFTYALFGGGLNYFKYFHDQICRFMPVFFLQKVANPPGTPAATGGTPKVNPFQRWWETSVECLPVGEETL